MLMSFRFVDSFLVIRTAFDLGFLARLLSHAALLPFARPLGLLLAVLGFLQPLPSTDTVIATLGAILLFANAVEHSTTFRAARDGCDLAMKSEQATDAEEF